MLADCRAQRDEHGLDIAARVGEVQRRNYVGLGENAEESSNALLPYNARMVAKN
jgi:hypothetical protein